MPWKLIGLAVLLVLVGAFATLNLSNRTDISLGVHVFDEVPIFLSLFVAFLAGILVTIPFTIGRSRRKQTERSRRHERALAGGMQTPAPGREAMEPPAAPPARDVAEEAATEARPRTPPRGRTKSTGSGKSKRR